MQTNVLKALLAFVLAFALIALAGRMVLAQGWLAGGGTAGEFIALINVEGMITAGADAGSMFMLSGMASSMTICEQLYEARDDNDVRAVVLRVNSPGGAAAASDEIYRAVQDCAATKPVVVSMGDVAASGGYYVAAPASYVFANGATLTGSIGVIFSLINWGELAETWGIRSETLTAGDYKDIGSPWRDMTEPERQLLKGLLTDVHEQFISAVAAGRANLTEEQVREVATGMVFTGEQALELGLVDELGGLHAAAAKARELAGVDEDVPLEQVGGTSFLEELFSLRGGLPPEGAALRWLLSREPLTGLAQGLYLNATLRDLVMR